MMTEIVYEDADILVVYKPAGLATQTAKTGQKDVVSELKNYLQRSRKNRVGQGAEVNPIWGCFTVWTSRWRDCWYLQRIRKRRRP